MVDSLRSDGVYTPSPSRFAANNRGYEQAMGRHRHAVECGLSSYRDPATGYTVLTGAYLAERGYCCSAGCRHCPYVGA